ncbi:MAG TPA: S53 family peptidase, partial [Streptosporangiaceae bacterium]|nr:S53 family peptidase [Streptosporangiaceae bacterium]
RTGIMPSSATLHLDVALTPRNAAALSQYASQVSTPGSALYHRYLAKGQFAGMFGATNATITAVLAALRAAGLHPGAVSSNHLSIPVTATVAQVESAFGVSMANYRLPGGRTGFANTSAPKLPANIAPSVEAVIGLDNLNLPHSFMTKPSPHVAKRPRTTQPAVNTGGPQPCTQMVNFRNSIGAPFTAFTADQLAFAYEFSGLYKSGDFGRGVAVGIVEFGEPNSPNDIKLFQNCYGTHTKVSYDKVDHFGQHGPGEGEAALDIETVLSLAPNSNIIVYQAPNTGAAAYDIYKTMVSQDRVRVISESYGLCEHYQDPRAANAVTLLYEQAAVQGQTIVASSGDAGSEACLPNDGNKNRLSVNFPASDPLVLGVGGTAIENLAARPGEVVWNDGNDGDGAGGGGKSSFYAEPSWQKSFKIKSKVREVPDVSADADPETGYIIIHKSNLGVIGGTSAAAPLWAALIALTDAKCSSSPVGWANPAIYFAASPKVKAVVINDIVNSKAFPGKVNNNYTHPKPGHPYPVTGGYDAATGLGTPVGNALAGELCKLDAEPGGYWLATANGHVSAFHEPFHGSLAGKHLSAAVTGIAGTSKGGYYLVTAKGQVSAFGAPFHGSVRHPNGRVVGIATDKSGTGYWVVTNNGHVYNFNAPARGSAHTSGVIGIAADPQTNGYWVATSRGKVFAFHAKNFGSKSLSGVTGIGSDPRRQGFWLVTSKGKVAGFGISSDGSMPANVGTVVGIAGDAASGGYWLATATGHVGAFFAAWHGDQAGSKSKIVGIAGG